jgi:WS/DGAT/MGAT family acyltransferase
MHFGAVAFASAEAWRSPHGSFAFEELRSLLISRAGEIPALRRRLSHAPLSGWPIWLTAESIDWDWHVQVAAEASTDVKRIAQALMAEPLDRLRPLWRILIIPQPDDSPRFAMIFLAHHALVDGIAGIDLLSQLFDGQSRGRQAGPAARPAGSIFANEIGRWLGAPLAIARGIGGALANPLRRKRFARRTKALVRTSARLLTPGPQAALKDDSGGARNIGWMDVEDRPLRRARHRLSGTPNDIVLAAVASAVDGLPGVPRNRWRRVRAAVPVSFRKRQDRHSPGNKIGLQLVALDSRGGRMARSVAAIQRQTSEQSQRGDAEGYEVLTEVTAWAGLWSQRLLHWVAASVHSYAVLVTNVPGPSRTYSIGGAELDEIYPLVPLFGGQALSVGVIRYAGRLRIGVVSSTAKPALQAAFMAGLQEAFAVIVRTPAEPERAEQRVPGVPIPSRQPL